MPRKSPYVLRLSAVWAGPTSYAAQDSSAQSGRGGRAHETRRSHRVALDQSSLDALDALEAGSRRIATSGPAARASDAARGASERE